MVQCDGSFAFVAFGSHAEEFANHTAQRGRNDLREELRLLMRTQRGYSHGIFVAAWRVEGWLANARPEAWDYQYGQAIATPRPFSYCACAVGAK